MNKFLLEQKVFIEKWYVRLKGHDEEFASKSIGNKWSPKEIIGHLIDSASNNHQRFIRAQFTDKLIFEGYDQDEWVKVHNYQNADWKLLLKLWRNYNHLLLYVAFNIPEEVLLRKRTDHNCDKIAFNLVPQDQTITLEYFIKDYFDHLHHHIEQLENQYLSK